MVHKFAQRTLPLAGLISILIAQPILAQQKGASLTLRGSWTGTPYYAEAAELVAEEDRSLFWTFFERATSAAEPADSAQCWAHIVNTTTSVLPPGAAQLAPLILSSRQYTAKVEMLRQLTAQLHPNLEGCCMVDVSGHTAFSASDLAKAIAAAEADAKAGVLKPAQLFAFDHVMEGGKQGKHTRSTGAAQNGTTITAVLYAPLGPVPCTRELHTALQQAVGQKGITYSVRPLLSAGCKVGACTRLGSEGPLLLPGWGVEAVLKNTEYSAMDEKERPPPEESQDKGDAGSSDEVLATMDDEEEGEVKVWEVKDVGLKATQRIMQASDPLAYMTDLSQNFPTLVSSLSRQRVNESLRKAVTHNQQYLSPGMNFMLINGLAFDINDFDLFGLYDRLRSEMQTSSQLSRLGLTGTDLRQVLQLRTEDDTGSISSTRLDLGLGPGGSGLPHVLFLNNLEQDTMYTSRFSSSIADILSTFPGRLRPLAVNAFTLVLVVDPTSAEGLILIDMLYQMWREYYPIRIGVSYKVPDVVERLQSSRRPPYKTADTPSWGSMSAAERFSRAALTLEHAFGAPVAFEYWAAVSQDVQTTNSWGEDVDERLKPAFTAIWAAQAKSPTVKSARSRLAGKKKPEVAWSEVVEGKGAAAEAGMRLADMAAWQMNKGITAFPKPAAWLNGAQIQLTEYGRPAQMQQDIAYRLLMEQQKLQELVYYGKLQDGRDIQAQVLEQTGALSRWNPGLVSETAPQVVSLEPLLNDTQLPWVPSFITRQEASEQADDSEDGDDDEQELQKGKQVPRKAGKGGRAVTHVVVVNLDAPEGRDLLGQAMRYLAEGLRGASDTRVVLLFNAPDHSRIKLEVSTPSLLELAAHVAVSQMAHKDAAGGTANVTSEEVAAFLTRLASDAPLAERLSGQVHGNDVREVETVVALARQAGLAADALYASILSFADVQPDAGGAGSGEPGGLYYAPPSVIRDRRRAHARLIREMGLQPGESAVITNGRLMRITPPQSADASDAAAQQGDEGAAVTSLVAEDFSLLYLIASKYQPGAELARVVTQAHKRGDLHGVAKPLTAIGKVKLDLTIAAAASVIVSDKPSEQRSGGGGGGSSLSKQLNMVMTVLRGRTIEIGAPLEAADTSIPPLHIVCILNPLTRPAQRISQVLSFLRSSPVPLSLSLILNPQRDLTELPLKAFYRYALPAIEPGDGVLTQLPGPPAATFKSLPRKRVLTLNADVPEPWLVEATEAAHDLDNLRLADIPEPVATAELELKALMLTGSCIDVTQGRGTPPRGLQLQLGPPGGPPEVDTLVMANLAYFQLKAAPGRWELSLAPGRTQELYTLESSDGITGGASSSMWRMRAPEKKQQGDSGDGGDRDATTTELSTQVVVNSLAGKHMILRVRKRPGKEREDVLLAAGEKATTGLEVEEEEEDPYAYLQAEEEDDEYDDGYDTPKTSKKKSKKKAPSKADVVSVESSSPVAAPPEGDVINVFTVASGHMYERLQKIMILSVLNHTKSRVKFWFISNYMSPQHKQVIPQMAEHFGFDYAFVTYKWPHWLHKQTDKQRIIWAYKILFLDVLFPLSVQRIIFVDSDQVVRTDLAELYHMNIRGAPYAYTPFCDNNKEMDEFRFWKGGFWHQHLQGKPYHISALYLVDVKRFRAIAAGDQLRVIYDQLSKDPNSLANLDQDLPNYAQLQIPIFSLPQEWLWCESWCGNSTKGKAKTIDLCNNPKTKEPKLSAARRIIAEWPAYDQMQAEFTAQIDATLGSGAGAAGQAAAAAGSRTQPGSPGSCADRHSSTGSCDAGKADQRRDEL